MNREPVIRRLLVGDIFHAKAYDSEASLTCLVMSVNAEYLTVRTVTSQITLNFSCDTGASEDKDGNAIYFIDSCAPLPIDMHQIMLGLDRKFRLWDDMTKIALNNDEKLAILFAQEFYDENPM
jgi:hypothetical protein